VFDPARLRVVLGYLGVTLASDLAIYPNGDGGGARGAFVKAEDDCALTVECRY
jgi:hypothetical protein